MRKRAINVERPPQDRNMLEGDIVVTAMARHFAISRMRATGEPQEYLAAGGDRGQVLEQACVLAGATHRVFLYANAGTSEHVPFDCPKRVK